MKNGSEFFRALLSHKVRKETLWKRIAFSLVNNHYIYIYNMDRENKGSRNEGIFRIYENFNIFFIPYVSYGNNNKASIFLSALFNLFSTRAFF